MDKSVLEYIYNNMEKTVKYSPKDDDTLIGLPHKYTTPCASDMFQEIYYWDTYFTNVGLILMGKTELAKSNVDNMLFLIEKYGFMPNGNRTFYLNRSQPPFLSKMVRDIFEETKDTIWLDSAYGTLKKEYSFWQTKRVFDNELNGYTGYVFNEDEVSGNSKAFFNRTGHRFNGDLTYDIKYEFAKAAMSFNESGWDCNSRFGINGHNYCSVDLNSLLFDMEENMLYFSTVLKNGEEEFWKDKKDERRKKMQVLWNDKEGYFTDYNHKTNEFSNYFSAASFYPLFCSVATTEQAKKTVNNLKKLELKFGVSAGEANPQWSCQWDYPNIWAPIQFIVYKGLMNYGYTTEAKRIAEKYIALIDNGFSNTGNLWEKYDGNTGKVVANEYEAPPMMGWTAGVYIYFCNQK